MKFIILAILLSNQAAYAWKEIHCDGKNITVKLIKKTKYYMEAKIKLVDPTLIALAGGDEIEGLAYASYLNPDGFEHAIFRVSPPGGNPDVLKNVVQLRNKSGRTNVYQADLTISREGKTECLQYEENCSCCYYNDCSPQCLKERVIPWITYLGKEVTCEEI